MKLRTADWAVARAARALRTRVLENILTVVYYVVVVVVGLVVLRGSGVEGDGGDSTERM